jgi:hypothetical protein
MAKRAQHLRAVGSEPEAPLPYDRHETAAEIAYRIRNGIKRRPVYVSEAGR